MGLVVVVTGPPGAGKSATADALVRLLDPSALVPGDAFFGFLRNGAVAPWLPAAHRQNTAVLEAAAAATGRLAQHCDVVYEGILGPWFLETFVAAARVVDLHYVVLQPPLEVCLERVRTRPGHGFTDLEAAEHMWEELRRAPLAPQHALDDHEGPPVALARRVVELVRSGAIRYGSGSLSS